MLQVPFCDQMDESLLDALCERLRPALCIEGANILREGDPVNEMFFIIRGEVESVTTNGGRTGFFNRAILRSGAYCGEELLTWALDPKPQNHLPISTRTVKAVKEVEAFSLSADDLKFVASQFRRLHSKQLQHTFRYYSNHWRTWGACFIQSAWRRYQRRRLAELHRKEEDQYMALQREPTDKLSLGATILAGRFAKNAMRSVHRLRNMRAIELARISNIPKPSEPDFSQDTWSPTHDSFTQAVLDVVRVAWGLTPRWASSASACHPFLMPSRRSIAHLRGLPCSHHGVCLPMELHGLWDTQRHLYEQQREAATIRSPRTD